MAEDYCKNSEYNSEVNQSEGDLLSDKIGYFLIELCPPSDDCIQNIG
jgi:hypothetical protein